MPGIEESRLASMVGVVLSLCMIAHPDVVSAYPKPCAGLQPIFLLQKALPLHTGLPHGVSLVYDRESHVHAYTFKDMVSELEFAASEIFVNCDYFPEEFSIFFTIKNEQLFTNNECIFCVYDKEINQNILSLKLSRGRLIVIYENQRIVFKGKELWDSKWHTISISVTGDYVIMTSDCKKERIRRVRRSYPALLDVTKATFQIGRCWDSSRSFQGVLHELLILPGADTAYKACPIKSIPPPIDNRIPTAYDLEDRLLRRVDDDGECSWTNVGNLAYDIPSNSIRVCVNGIWRPVSQRQGGMARRLDYFENYQDVETMNPSIDVEVFSIPNEGLFAAFASSGEDGNASLSTVFKWTDRKFRPYQKLNTFGAQSWRYFEIGHQSFLAVANYGTQREATNSTIFRWDRRRKKFRIFQEILTWTARDFEPFTINRHHYLAVANYAKDEDPHCDSLIYSWNTTTRRFEELQRISTVGAYDWTFFETDGFHFLAIANAFNGATTLMDSAIYIWQIDKFIPFQTLETNGATDWEYFKINGDAFLAVANAYNYGPQNYQNTDTHLTNSTIYKLNRAKRHFERFQTITTYSAIDWEYFEIGDEKYLAISNVQNGAYDEQERSIVYRWQGLDQFVPAHSMFTLPSADWESFTYEGEKYLIYANGKSTTSQIIKAKYL